MLLLRMLKHQERFKVFVQKENLTSRGGLPSSQELYDLMHLTTCQQAEARWKDHWQFCPVCLQATQVDNEGEDYYVLHSLRKDIIQ